MWFSWRHSGAPAYGLPRPGSTLTWPDAPAAGACSCPTPEPAHGSLREPFDERHEPGQPPAGRPVRDLVVAGAEVEAARGLVVERGVESDRRQLELAGPVLGGRQQSSG